MSGLRNLVDKLQRILIRNLSLNFFLNLSYFKLRNFHEEQSSQRGNILYVVFKLKEVKMQSAMPAKTLYSIRSHRNSRQLCYLYKAPLGL